MKTLKLLATDAQKKVLHRIKRQKGMSDDMYRDLIRQFSNGRTDTSRELTKDEATQLISRLLDEDGRDASLQRKKHRLVCRIYRISCEISGLNGDYNSSDPVEKQMNIAKLNAWIRQYGACKKPISQQNYEELKQTHRQITARLKREEGDVSDI